VIDYLESLKGYDTVVMGRATYEFGYQFGLQPGQPAYPHMKHYIFSKTLKFDTPPSPQVEVVDKDELEVIRCLKEEDGTDIYLCGGGAFAGFLAEHDQIDELRIKLMPYHFRSWHSAVWKERARHGFILHRLQGLSDWRDVDSISGIS